MCQTQIDNNNSENDLVDYVYTYIFNNYELFANNEMFKNIINLNTSKETQCEKITLIYMTIILCL